jgi:hypothetical protein
MRSNEDYKAYKERMQKDFFDKYPMLFPNGHPRCGFSVDYGWWPLLTTLCDDLMKIVEESPLPMEEKAFRVDQVKEKFGGLRFYLGAVHESISEKVYERVTESESLSFKVCEKCGQPGSEGGLGWIKTLCDDCQNEMEREAVQGNGRMDRARNALVTKMGLVRWLDTPRAEREKLIAEEWERIRAKTQPKVAHVQPKDIDPNDLRAENHQKATVEDDPDTIE